MPLSGGGICVILVNSWPQALPSSSSFLTPSLLLVSAVCSLCWTAWTNNPKTTLISHWSVMPLVNLFGSKWKLLLSALLICAVIFDLGKWLYSLADHFCDHVFLELLRRADFCQPNACHGLPLHTIKIVITYYSFFLSINICLCLYLWTTDASCALYTVCQKDAQEQRTTPGRTSKPSKPKLGKTTNKGPRAVTAKPKIKTTPAAPAQTVLTQVFHLLHKIFVSIFAIWRPQVQSALS